MRIAPITTFSSSSPLPAPSTNLLERYQSTAQLIADRVSGNGYQLDTSKVDLNLNGPLLKTNFFLKPTGSGKPVVIVAAFDAQRFFIQKVKSKSRKAGNAVRKLLGLPPLKKTNLVIRSNNMTAAARDEFTAALNQ